MSYRRLCPLFLFVFGTAAFALPLPPVFQANQGQMESPVRYFAAGHGSTLALSPGQARLCPADGLQCVVIAFPDSPQARIEAEDPLPFHFNSIRGADPKRWVMQSLAWSRVRYRRIQPGVDLVFRSSGSEWEFDFDLAPGADPSRVQFEVRGSASLEVDARGDLLAGSIRWRKPTSYQQSGAVRRAIPTAFVVSGARVGFSVAAWDRSKPLVIDPAFVFSTYFGGSGNETARGIGRDSTGATYICGSSNSANLATTRTSFQSGYRGGSAINLGDAFLAKFTPSGALSFVTYFGGTADDVCTALAVDSNDAVYLTGFTASTDLPILGGFQKNYGGSGGNHFGEGGDAFVAKFTSAGALSYSSYLGGTQDDAGLAIAVDAAGNAYVAGSTLSPNFPAAGGYQAAFGGTDSAFVNNNGYVALHTGDAFVAKISPSGQQLLAATYLGGKLDDVADAIALDSSGNVWVGGSTSSTNFPVVNALQPTFGGGSPGSVQPVANLGDGFVSKLNPGLTSLLYSTFLGGSGDDGVTAIVVDSAGSVYLAGLTASSNFPTTTGVAFKGPTTLAKGRSGVSGDAFLAKLNPNGKPLTYSTLLGGSENDFASALAVDAAGAAYIVGMTGSADFPVTGTPQQTSLGAPPAPDGVGVGDSFLAKFDANAKLVYSSYLGGNGYDIAYGLAIDNSGSAYVVGLTTSSNFPTFAPFQAKNASSNRGGYNSFLTVVSGLGSALVAVKMTASAGSTPQSAVVGSAFANALAVTVADANGLPVPGVSVTFTAPASGAGGTFAGGAASVAVATNGSGVATAATFTANNNPGTYNVTAAASGLAAVNFALTNTAPAPVLTSVQNAASLAQGAVAPGEIVLISGTGLGPAVKAAGAPDPAAGILGSNLAGAGVMFDGLAAPIVSASAAALTAIVPYEVDGAASTNMVVSYNGQSSAPMTLAVAQTAPGLYSADSSGSGQALATNGDSSPNSAASPANAGDSLTLFGTGEGQTNPPGADGLVASDTPPQPVQPVSVTIEGVPAQVAYFGGIPGQVAGMLQIVVQVPDGLDAGGQPVVLTVGNGQSQQNLTVSVSGGAASGSSINRKRQ